MKAILLAAAIGACFSAAMVALGFNFHIGRTIWLGGAPAYLPAAIICAGIGAIIADAWQRKWQP